MVSQSNFICSRGDLQTEHAPQIKFKKCFWLAGLLGGKENQPLAVTCIRDGNQTFSVVEPAQPAVADPVRLAMLQNRPLPIGH